MTGTINKITCKICGLSWPNIATHVNKKHKISIAEYKNRFPGAQTATEEFRQKIRLQVKNRFVSNPELRKKVSSRTFDFITNKQLTQLLQRDYKSAKICLENGLWKPSIVLYASIIEAVLKAKHPTAKTFKEAVEFSYNEKEIPEKQYHQISIVRDLRNYVHIDKELSEGSEINEYWAKTFADICESIIKKFKEF